MAATSPVPVDPYPVMDTAPMEETLATVTTIYAESLPETVALLPAAAVVLAGAYVTTELLKNKQWDDFWVSVGGHLNDVWHAAGNFLFGGHGAPSLDTVGQLIQLSMHVNMRATRQLVTTLAGKTAAVEGALYKGVTAVARTVQGLTTWTAAQLNQLRHDVDAEIAHAGATSSALVHNAVVAADALAAQRVASLRAEIIRDITNPITSHLHEVEHDLYRVTDEFGALARGVKAHIVPELAAATAIGIAAHALAAKAEAFVDDCGEAMCETVGPKTDWGKLFKRFGTAGILALLAAVEAVDPEAAEHAATGFAETIGPVLERWTTEWLGLAGGGTQGEPTEVAHDVGTLSL